jgi:hypothetical protein
MSDGERDRASRGVEARKSSQKWSAQRSTVRSIAWLDLGVAEEREPKFHPGQGRSFFLRRARAVKEMNAPDAFFFLKNS